MCAYDVEEQVVFVEELCFARICQQTTTGSLLLSSDMWGLQKKNSYLLSQIANADEMPLYFHLPVQLHFS
jgi:hypothetical protein